MFRHSVGSTAFLYDTVLHFSQCCHIWAVLVSIASVSSVVNLFIPQVTFKIKSP